LASHTITVRCSDLAGNQTEKSVTVVVIDKTPPHYTIDTPPENARIPVPNPGPGTTVTAAGPALCLQHRVSTGEWSPDGTTFALANTGDDWKHWSIGVPIPTGGWGAYAIHLRFTDDANNSTSVVRHFEVVSAYKPRNTDELLSARSYLEALLQFAAHHIN